LSSGWADGAFNVTVCEAGADWGCAAPLPDCAAPLLDAVVALELLEPEAAFCALADGLLCALSPFSPQTAETSSAPIAIQCFTRIVRLPREILVL
jgi:hypothetical protein